MRTDKTQKTFLFIVLSVIYGVYFLFLLIWFFNRGGITEHKEWLIYIWGWLAVPALSVVTTLAVVWLQNKFFQGSQNFYPALLLLNSFYLLIAVIILRVFSSPLQYCDSVPCVMKLLNAQVPDWETGKFLVKTVPRAIARMLVIFFPVFNILVCCFAKVVSKRLGFVSFGGKVSEERKGAEARLPERQGGSAGDFCYFVMPFLLGLTALNFSSIKTQNFSLLILASVCSFLWFFHKTIVEFKPGKIFQMTLNIITILLICFLVFDPSFSINRAHQNPYLDPVCDLLGRKALLVDINSQYGVWVAYFLKIFFSVVPLSYPGLTLINIVMTIIYYVVIYVILRYLLKSPLIAMIFVFVIILVNFFATLGGEIVAFPSLGPLRFALPFFLLLVAIGRFHFPQLLKVFQWLAGFIMALASIWSFETFVYTLVVYICMMFYESCWKTNNFLGCLKRTAIGFLWLVPFILTAQLLFGLSVYARSGQWPHWNYYMDYIFLYSIGGWGGMAIGLWSPWILLVVIPMGTLIALVFHVLDCVIARTMPQMVQGTKQSLLQRLLRSAFGGTRNDGKEDDQQVNPQLTILAGLTGLAIIEYTYFVGRSHVNNLFHVSVPVLCLAAYMFVSLARMDARELKWFSLAATFCSYVAFFFMVFSLTPKMVEKLKIRLPQYSKIKENFVKPPTTPQVGDALYLIEKYAMDKPRVALFIDPDDTTETLMRSRKVHVYPFNYPIIVSISPAVSQRVLDFQSPLKTGDYLFLSKEASEFQQQIVKSIQEKFSFTVRETTPHGVYAIELK